MSASHHLSLQTLRGELAEWLDFFRAETHLLEEQPQLLFQQAANQSDATAPAKTAERRFEAGIEVRPWLRWTTKTQNPSKLLMTLTLDSSYMVACAFLSDGSRIVAITDSGALRVWDATSGREGATFSIGAHALSSDGTRVITDRNDGMFRLHDSLTGAELASFPNSGRLAAWAFSRDGTRIATGRSGEGRIKLWNGVNGTEIATLMGDPGWQNDIVYFHYGLAFSDDSRYLIGGGPTAFADGTIRIWNAANGTLMTEVLSPRQGVMERYLRRRRSDEFHLSSCSFSPDGTHVVVAVNHKYDVILLPQLSNNKLRVYDLNGSLVAILDGHQDGISVCKFAPDGTHIVSGSIDGTLKIWSIPPDQPPSRLSYLLLRLGLKRSKRVALVKPLCELVRHTSGIRDIVFSADGKHMLSASEKELKMWDAVTWHPVETFQGSHGIKACAFSPDGDYVVSAGGNRALNGFIEVWDPSRKSSLLRQSTNTTKVFRCEFSPDGTKVASATVEGSLKLWDAESGEELLTLEDYQGRIKVNQRALPYRRTCAFSPDGKRIVSAYDPEELKVWDTRTGALLFTMPIKEGTIESFNYSPDGMRIVSQSSYSNPLSIRGGEGAATVTLWDATSGEPISTLRDKWQNLAHSSFRFSPDGRWILATLQGRMALWDADAGTPLEVEFDETNSDKYDFSTSRRVVTNSISTSPIQWQTDSRGYVTFRSHPEPGPAHRAISPDLARILIFESGGRLVKLLEAETGKVCFTVTAARFNLQDCRFSEGGNIVISHSEKGFSFWNVVKGFRLTEFRHSGVTAWDIRGERLAVGFDSGETHVLELKNFPFQPPIVTAWIAPSDGAVAVGCPACRQWYEIEASGLGKELPCPLCGCKVKLNIFMIKADWRRVAAAWRVQPK